MSTTTAVATSNDSNMIAPMHAHKKRLEGLTPNAATLQFWKEYHARFQIGNAPVSKNSIQKDAVQILKAGPHPNQDPSWMPITIVTALRTLVDDIEAFDHALRGTSLVFTSPPPVSAEETREKRRFKQRMDKLRLQYEETKYVRLTNNLQNEVHDDITAKSMTYAASVGLNMIVAPISFGCFMYFFAGGIFDYFLGQEFSSRTTGGTDIKRVIVGVISGVVMLFIEMTLFVIRTHEVEAAQTKKNKKKKAVQPFGVYSKKGDRQAMPIDPSNAAHFKKTD